MLFLLLFIVSSSRNNDPGMDKSNDNVISYEKWKEITRERSYVETFREITPRDRRDRRSVFKGWSFENVKTFVSFIVGTILVILFAVIIFLILKYFLNYFDEKVPNKPGKISFDNLEENLHESDLDALLNRALSEGAYALCIRIYYLKIIKSLSERHFINWKKDKTNYRYVNEMATRPEGRKFVWLTNVYEQVWFGNTRVDKSLYDSLRKHFSDYLNKINPGEA
ncbi:MAG: DUF4129 domain-containing protein [Bacteroidales bacterium]|jgi:hypothetical protein